jgi:hypothetical protein
VAEIVAKRELGAVCNLRRWRNQDHSVVNRVVQRLTTNCPIKPLILLSFRLRKANLMERPEIITSPGAGIEFHSQKNLASGFPITQQKSAPMRHFLDNYIRNKLFRLSTNRRFARYSLAF